MPNLSDTQADKAALRARVRQVRAALEPAYRADASLSICATIAALSAVTEARVVMVYGAAPDEVDLTELAERLRASGIRTLYPKVSSDQIVAIEVVDEAKLVDGYRGIREPVGEPVDPSIIDVVIVPGLAFDTTGGRLGQGKAYYDRFLPRTQARRVAVAFDAQVVEQVPREPHDLLMHTIVTERRVISA